MAQITIRIDGVSGNLAASKEFQALARTGMGEGLLVIPELGLETSNDVLVTLGRLVEPGAESLTAMISETPDGLGLRTALMIVTVVMDRLLQLGQSPCGDLLSHEFQSVEVRFEDLPPEVVSANWVNPGTTAALSLLETMIGDLELVLPEVRLRMSEADGDDEARSVWTQMAVRLEKRVTDLQRRQL